MRPKRPKTEALIKAFMDPDRVTTHSLQGPTWGQPNSTKTVPY